MAGGAKAGGVGGESASKPLGRGCHHPLSTGDPPSDVGIWSFIGRTLDLNLNPVKTTVGLMRRPPAELADKLIKAGEKLAGSGPDFSVEDVAKAAGVPRATLYYYFSGKSDLADFFLNDKLERVRIAIAKAAAQEGTVIERLQACVRAVLHALAEYPILCTELPATMHGTKDHSEVAINAERVLTAPIRELLIEGRAAGELSVPDPGIAATALNGAVGFVAMQQFRTHGSLDADSLADLLIPCIIDGLRMRNQA